MDSILHHLVWWRSHPIFFKGSQLVKQNSVHQLPQWNRCRDAFLASSWSQPSRFSWQNPTERRAQAVVSRHIYKPCLLKTPLSQLLFPSFWKKIVCLDTWKFQSQLLSISWIWFKVLLLQNRETQCHEYQHIERSTMESTNFQQVHSTPLHFLQCLHLRGTSVEFFLFSMSIKISKTWQITDPKPRGLPSALLEGMCVIVLQVPMTPAAN